MEKLRVGVIGLGMGKGHVKAFQAHPHADVVAVADTDPARLQQRADELGIPRRYAQGEEMLEKERLDLVSIATPNRSHHPLTLRALEAGCHVLCEKPMAMNAAEAREMMAAAQRAQRRLMINFSTRFCPASWAMKQEIEQGTIGTAYFARTVWLRRRGIPRFGSWFGQKEYSGGGPLIDLGVHRLDLVLWALGYPKPLWVAASTYDRLGTQRAREEAKRYDVEDFAVALIRFENGVTLELEASWAGHIRPAELMETRILGDRGGLLHTSVSEVEPYRWTLEVYTERSGFQYDWKLRDSVAPVPTAMAHFVDCILNNRPHMATGEEGLRVQELLDTMYASAGQGKPIAMA